MSGQRIRGLAVAGLGLLVAFCLGLASASVAFAASPPPLYLHPADESVVAQNPPDLRWPWFAVTGRFVVELQGPDGRLQRLETSSNATAWPSTLEPGRYRWRLLGRPPAELARDFSFTVPPGAAPFLLPAAPSLLARAASAARPRFHTEWSGSNPELKSTIVRKLLAGAGRPTPELAAVDRRERQVDREKFAFEKRRVKQDGARTADRLLALALVAHHADDDRIQQELTRLLLEVASWDPDGASGVDGVHLVARDLVVALAVAYDAMHLALDPAQRMQVSRSIVRRASAIHREFIANAAMQRHPYNSHGWVTWGGAAAALSLVAGESTEADALFLEMVPAFIHSISPWGAESGGFANGTAYGAWDVASLIVPLDVLSSVLGVDIYQKAWLRNFPRFLTYFNPPGGPGGAFGDGAEIVRADQLAWTVRALAQRVPDPLAQWHAAQLRPDAGTSSTLMLSALRSSQGSMPFPAVPHSAVLRDIGWAALHSDLADPRRTSVYFKSSPYGSHSHSHADQNALVLHAGGKALLVGSGHYDFYGSQHFTRWYQTTQAHNAITFDGGTGQPTQRIGAGGRIVTAASGPGYDVVVGDASRAYAGQLHRALRTVVYLRPGTVLVHDVLVAPEPRRWEWNFHALERMVGDERQVRVKNGDQVLCIDVLAAPKGEFRQRTGYAVPPRDIGKNVGQKDQWHAVFAAAAPSLEAEYVIALRVGCQAGVPSIERDSEGWRVVVADGQATRTVQLRAGSAVVR